MVVDVSFVVKCRQYVIVISVVQNVVVGGGVFFLELFFNFYSYQKFVSQFFYFCKFVYYDQSVLIKVIRCIRFFR